MNPLLIILLIFVVAPLTELYLLIQVGTQVGAINTIGFSLLTAVIGGYLVRHQGISTIMRINQASARGELPAVEMLEGAVLLVCGLLLLLPGFITDALGFLLLIPALRRALILSHLKHLTPTPGSPRGSQHTIIDAEYHEVRKEAREIDHTHRP